MVRRRLGLGRGRGRGLSALGRKPRHPGSPIASSRVSSAAASRRGSAVNPWSSCIPWSPSAAADRRGRSAGAVAQIGLLKAPKPAMVLPRVERRHAVWRCTAFLGDDRNGSCRAARQELLSWAASRGARGDRSISCLDTATVSTSAPRKWIRAKPALRSTRGRRRDQALRRAAQCPYRGTRRGSIPSGHRCLFQPGLRPHARARRCDQAPPRGDTMRKTAVAGRLLAALAPASAFAAKRSDGSTPGRRHDRSRP